MKGYTKGEISEKTGLAPRLVQFYTEEGIVTPEVDEGGGRGRFRRYSKWNLFQFGLIKELTHYGINLSTIRMVMEQWNYIKSHYDKKNKNDGFEKLLFGDSLEQNSYIWLGKDPHGDEKGGLWGEPFLAHPGEIGKRAVIDDGFLKEIVSVLVIDLCELYRRVCT